MPELWLNYGSTDIIVDLKVENLSLIENSKFDTLALESLDQKIESIDMNDNTILIPLDASNSTIQLTSRLVSFAETKGIKLSIESILKARKQLSSKIQNQNIALFEIKSDHFLERTNNKDTIFISKTKRISELVDGIHLTDNVLGIPRVSSLMLVSMLKRNGITKPMSCTCRLYDKNLISVLQFVTDAILCGVYSILVLRGDDPIIGNKFFNISPSKAIKTLSEHNFDNYIKLDLSFPNKVNDTMKIKNKLEAKPRAFVTQSISNIDNLRDIVKVSAPYGIDVIPCIMCPSSRNEISAQNIGLDWHSYKEKPENFIREAASLTKKILLCSPNSFEDGLRLVRKLREA